MAEVTPPTPGAPSAEELQRQLEQVRAAQPPDAVAPASQRSVGSILLRRGLRMLGLWFVLVLAFLAIWQFLVPQPQPQRRPAPASQ